ncbi:MAG: response regulator receiver protein [Labilithrix sp.]|nr:response regulator receiver protein [Labilithrix sp.]
MSVVPKTTVLVVDDDRDNAEILEAALDSYAFDITTAGSFVEAKQKLAALTFDALVTDYSLGDGTAVELLESLGPTRPKVAILVTGYGAPEDRARSRAAGFDAHLVKPINVKELEAALHAGLAAR